MEEVQKFALKHIHCSPGQDKQYRFKLIKVSKEGVPSRGQVKIYGRVRPLPNSKKSYHVYVLGNVPAFVLNLMGKRKSWVRDIWYNVEADINERGILIQFYGAMGNVFPRDKIFYSVGNGELTIALEDDVVINERFDPEDMRFLRVYSNENFSNTNTVNNINCSNKVVFNNQDIVSIQSKVIGLEADGGKALVYVDGLYCDKVTLSIPHGSNVEILYDRSIISKETYLIKDLRTFRSVKDERVKYLLNRERITDSIQYEDDLEIYLSSVGEPLDKGLYYFQHKHYALTNVTDKDFALDSNFVNNQNLTLNNDLESGRRDKAIVIFTRLSSYDRSLVYSSLKLHELYKLPKDRQRDVINNSGYLIPEFRVEYLEDSPYFKIASAKELKALTKELTTEAVGYNGVSYYYGMTPNLVNGETDIQVPYLYRSFSMAYEYNIRGVMTGHFLTVGPVYDVKSTETKHVEFVQGVNLEEVTLYSYNEEIPLKDFEYRVIESGYFTFSQLGNWKDITNDPSVEVSEGFLKVVKDKDIDEDEVEDEDVDRRIRIVYLNEIASYDYTLDASLGVMEVNLTSKLIIGNENRVVPLDLPFDSLEVFLNGRRLTYKIDFDFVFPRVIIYNKTYIDYTSLEQSVHVRLTGFNLDKSLINKREITGFVSHGVLTRNNFYDIRDDKVFSVFVDGKLLPKDKISFSEEDNTVRVDHPSNGLPYTVNEHMLSIKEVTGLETLPYFNKNMETNESISSLYNVIYPEPTVDSFNVVGDHHYLYSPLISKILYDLINGFIRQEVYTNTYNDFTIQELITDKYNFYYELDPVKKKFPDNLIEIHPHLGNSTIPVSLFQYKFLVDVVRIITGGRPRMVNLNGYVTVDATMGASDTIDKNEPGGVIDC